MGLFNRIKEFFKDWLITLFKKPAEGLQPKIILTNLLAELEKKKKLGIEDKAFVPNFYVIYLNPFDFDELSPLLSGIKDQLKSKLMDKIKTKGYRILSSTVNLEIRQDRSLERNQMVVETSFIKEKNTPASNSDATTHIPSPSLSAKANSGSASMEEMKRDKKAEPPLRPPDKNGTRIVEEKRTKYIDPIKVRLKILEGVNKGEIIELREGEYSFGRGKEAKILLKDPEETISRKHFEIKVGEEKVFIKDLKSTNGTRINEIDIEEAQLKKGDTIRAGNLALSVA